MDAEQVRAMLKARLEERGISQSEFARMMGVSRQYIGQVFHGIRPVSPEMAKALDIEYEQA